MSLRDKVAIVTGAGTGIGRAIAERFAAEGARTIIADIDQVNGDAVARDLAAEGKLAEFLSLDVADPDSVHAVVDAVLARHGALDILVNNAAITNCPDEFLTMPLATWQRVIDVNLTGVFLCSQAAANAMVPRGGGRIINLASVGSFMPQPNVPHYIAAKGGVLMLTRTMAFDLARYGIVVNAIAPGPIRTASQEALYASGSVAATLAHVPLGREGRLSEIANVAAFLASDEASYINGETIVVDGGFLMGLHSDHSFLEP